MIDFSEGLAALRSGIAIDAHDVFQPQSKLTVSEWADANRRLPSNSPIPGRFRTDFIPYMRRIQDVLGDESVREVVFAKASQVAGSTAGENFLGWIMDQSPSAVLQVWPSEEKLKKWSLTRLDPMIDETPCLRAKFPRSGRRDSGDSIAYKEFSGGWLKAITAKSTIALKSDTARVAIAEEVDEWEGDVNDQGDPLELLLVRLRNYWNRKLYVVSTPTVLGASRVWSLLEQSTWEEYWVPCPHCGHMQTLRWRDEKEGEEDAGFTYRLIFERNAAGEVVPGSTCYVCDECSVPIPERKKGWMLRRGEWRARYPGRERVGFHINVLYSPLCPWDDVARAFLRSKDSPSKLKVFHNTWLGLPFRDVASRVESHVLSERTVPYPAPVPRGVGLLTAGVDVQADRLEVVVWGWGAHERSWVIAWRQIDILKERPADAWAELDEVLIKGRWKHEDGAELGIAAAAVDAGYESETVWRYCEARRAHRIIATVGRSGPGKQLITPPDPAKYKKSKAKRKPMHTVGVDSGKSMLYGRLGVGKPEAPGYVHFPDTLDPVFFDQLTSEQLITKYEKGRPYRTWELIAGRRNEALDCSVYAMAALAFLGQKTINSLGALAEQVTEAGRALAAGSVAAPAGRRRRGRNVISSGLES